MSEVERWGHTNSVAKFWQNSSNVPSWVFGSLFWKLVEQNLGEISEKWKKKYQKYSLKVCLCAYMPILLWAFESTRVKSNFCAKLHIGSFA